jgi:hypothetical protein
VGKQTPDEVQDDLDRRYARFGLRPLSDHDVWTLSMAAMVMPDGSPGAEAYLMQVSGVANFAPRLTIWGRVVAIGIASGLYCGKDGKRRRAYVEGYDEAWGRYAVADGLTLALYGYAEEGIAERCKALKCGKQGYQRIRDFVGGALVNAIAEYRCALEWATGYRRDRVFEGRWEGVTGLKWDEVKSHGMMGREGKIYFPLFAPGCGATQKAPSLDDYDRVSGKGRTPHALIVDGKTSETLYAGLRPTDWWDESFARRTRKECPAVTIYPATD